MTEQFISRLKNWWWYHKTPVLIAAAVLAVGLYLTVSDSRAEKPDYHIGLVSTAAWSPEELTRMEEAICAAGEDLNGDGKVLVQVHRYTVDLADEDPNAGHYNYEKIAALDSDLVGNVSGIFLLEDPDTFRSVTNDILSEQTVPWEHGLFLTVRADADDAYTQLFSSLS